MSYRFEEEPKPEVNESYIEEKISSGLPEGFSLAELYRQKIITDSNSFAEFRDYMSKRKKFGKRLSLGIAMLMGFPALTVMMILLPFDTIELISGFGMLGFILYGIYLIIHSSIKFSKENKEAENLYFDIDVEDLIEIERQDNYPKFIKQLVIGIILCVGWLPLTIIFGIMSSVYIPFFEPIALIAIIASVFLLPAIGVYNIVSSSIFHAGFSKMLRQSRTNR